MSISKPNQVKWLENQIGAPVHPLRRGTVTDFQNRTCYELDRNGEVIGLNLAHTNIADGWNLIGMKRLTTLDLTSSNITDWGFLNEMGQLNTLHLGANKITDWSFLEEMEQLNALDLNSNKITDGSFLKDLKQLTSLNLHFNNITDGSFLKGMKQLTSLCLGSEKLTDGSFLREMNQLNSVTLFFESLEDWSFLKGISRLNYLNLSGNNIKDWSFLQGMSQLNTLYVGFDNITDGSFLKGMSQLTALYLRSNKITDGSFLKEMSQLNTLDLSSNKITDWSFLKGMSQLNTLDLSSNNITDGSFLKGMSQLNTLDLSSNNITDGSFLKGMRQLTALYLHSNKITDGSFLKGMSHLTALDLSSTNITDWSFLKEMSQLDTLALTSNNIADGTFLKGMRQLTALYLRSNKITDGSFLKEMNQLTTLDLNSNSIQQILSDFVDKDLELRNDNHNPLPYSINIYGNPLKEPPQEIVEQGHAAILAWYRASQEGEIDINELKIILVGDGSSGKTTVRKRLMKLSADPNESQTHGIEIHDYEVPCQGRSILTHFWDFGGQEIMHATHQFFLSRRSLYILLLDGRKEEDADYWLKHIKSFGGDSPILVCLNKIDQHPSFEVDRKNLKDKYPGIRDFYRLRCLIEDDTEVNRLIAELPQHIAKVEMLQSKWPRKWANVKDRLLMGDKPFVDRSEFAALCREEGIEEENQQHTLIRFLNDLGIALHFDDRRLRLLQILNPRWATQAVYRIIVLPQSELEERLDRVNFNLRVNRDEKGTASFFGQ